MIKGMDLIARLKYEMKNNLDTSSQSVKIPKKDLELLIELAESNQYRLDLELAEKLYTLAKNQKNSDDNKKNIKE